MEKDVCAFSKIIGLLGKKWMLLIIKSISDGCKSYSEIEKNLEGVNPRILSSRLKELLDFGIVEKKTLSQEPKKFIYCLTDTGYGLAKQVDSLCVWLKKNFK